MQEENQDIEIKIAEEIKDFKTLSPIASRINPVLSQVKSTPPQNIAFLLSKTWNLIQQVDFDIEKRKGNIITNVSFMDKDKIDKALDIMEETYNDKPKFISPYYKLVEHPSNDSMIGLATICSLSIDGILIDNGIMSNPKYGGLLELTEPPLFIDLISYNGSTEDPHMIFLAKNMTSITNNNGHSKILASFKEIPYISREQSVHILDILNNIGFPIYKIGKPREVTYNAKANNYNFGIVTGSGLNSIAAIKEKGIAVKVKAIEKLLPFEKMDRL